MTNVVYLFALAFAVSAMYFTGLVTLEQFVPLGIGIVVIVVLALATLGISWAWHEDRKAK